MDVRARREARAAHVGDDLAAAHVLAGADDDLHRVAVARHDAVAVVDVDHVAVAARIPAGRRDRAVSRRDDWRAHVVGDVDARVEVRAIPAQAIRRADLTACRPARRRRDRDSAADERARQRNHPRRAQ